MNRDTIATIRAAVLALAAVIGLSGTAVHYVSAQVRSLEKAQIEITNVKSDIVQTQIDVSDLKTDVRGLKTDVSDLKTEVRDLKTNVSDLKTDVSDLKTRFERLEERFGEFEQTQAKILEILLEGTTQTKG